MKHSFTPAPWKLIDDDMDYIAITDEEQEFGICELKEVASENRETMKANARLIAAAPELYEALNFLVETFNAHVGMIPLDVLSSWKGIRAAIEMAGVALDKVEGKSMSDAQAEERANIVWHELVEKDES